MENTKRKPLVNAEVGDILLVSSWHYPKRLEKVTKVTTASIFTGNSTRYTKKNGKCVGFDSISACIATDEDIKEVMEDRKRRALLNKIAKINFSFLSTEDLEAIFSIIQKENEDKVVKVTY